MKSNLNILIFLILQVLFFSCNQSKDKNQEKVKPVAKAGDEELTPSDMKDNLINTGNPKDSIGTIKTSIERWAIESLFYQEALNKLNEDEMQVEKEVQAYKKMLVNHIYQTRIIEANLDTTISKQEIEEYYNENKDNFILKDNIVKVNYYKIPLKAQALEKMKRLFYATTPKDKEQLQNLCIQYAENYFVNDSTWLYLDDIKKEIPKLRDQADFNIYAGRVVELNDDQFYYFLKIKEIKIKNGISPINFEKQNIKNFIINRRKKQLIEQYKLQLLDKARAEKKFTIY